MSKSELRVSLNGTNVLGVPLLDFSEIGLLAKCAAEYGPKVFEISCANPASAIDLFVDLFSKSATDVHALTAAQTRKDFETASFNNVLREAG